LVAEASHVSDALHELVSVCGWPAWNGALYGTHSCTPPTPSKV